MSPGPKANSSVASAAPRLRVRPSQNMSGTTTSGETQPEPSGSISRTKAAQSSVTPGIWPFTPRSLPLLPPALPNAPLPPPPPGRLLCGLPSNAFLTEAFNNVPSSASGRRASGAATHGPRRGSFHRNSANRDASTAWSESKSGARCCKSLSPSSMATSKGCWSILGFAEPPLTKSAVKAESPRLLRALFGGGAAAAAAVAGGCEEDEEEPPLTMEVPAAATAPGACGRSPRLGVAFAPADAASAGAMPSACSEGAADSGRLGEAPASEGSCLLSSLSCLFLGQATRNSLTRSPRLKTCRRGPPPGSGGATGTGEAGACVGCDWRGPPPFGETGGEGAVLAVDKEVANSLGNFLESMKCAREPMSTLTSGNGA
mmetsp:Transcript_143487/g.458792  ORF Transcript_143487/g.458792 Transcript_143487/m.458792 type:complete len:373 (+) Transcript_143487:556-1674(+)